VPQLSAHPLGSSNCLEVKMKIYDCENKRIVTDVCLYLTPKEAENMSTVAHNLSKHPESQHTHITNDDSSVEITIAVYTEQNLNQFDKESIAIIKGNQAAA
jgi:hypothetical protein